MNFSYEYFISYYVTFEDQFGFGSGITKLNERLKTHESFKQVSEDIKKELNAKSLTILYFKLLKIYEN